MGSKIRVHATLQNSHAERKRGFFTKKYTGLKWPAFLILEALYERLTMKDILENLSKDVVTQLASLLACG